MNVGDRIVIGDKIYEAEGISFQTFGNIIKYTEALSGYKYFEALADNGETYKNAYYNNIIFYTREDLVKKLQEEIN